MYLFGHIGLTTAAVRAVDRERDLRLPILLSILPDLIDKPIAFLLPALVNGNTRNFGHTLLGALVVLAFLLSRRRRLGASLLLWACYAGHLLLDRMWLGDGPIIFFWPLLGAFPRWSPYDPQTPHLIAYNVAGEALGLSIVLSLVWRHRLFERPRWNAFVKTGRLPLPIHPEETCSHQSMKSS
jgi:hypothetical protein